MLDCMCVRSGRIGAMKWEVPNRIAHHWLSNENICDETLLVNLRQRGMYVNYFAGLRQLLNFMNQ